MCLAVPAQIVQCDQTEALVDLHGNRVHVSTVLVDDARVGDWVLVHAGFAIQKLDGDEAQATFAILEDLADNAPVPRHDGSVGPRAAAPQTPHHPAREDI
jgi:hydrogenase expression/formation protein HypC